MKTTLVVILVAALMAVWAPRQAPGAELMPIERLEPLRLSFWTALDSSADPEAVRSAYLRGFFEATHIWGALGPENNAAAQYLRILQGMNLVQVANLLSRTAREYPQYLDSLALTQALTGCVVRARTGQPLLDDEAARAWGLVKPAAKAVAP